MPAASLADILKLATRFLRIECPECGHIFESTLECPRTYYKVGEVAAILQLDTNWVYKQIAAKTWPVLKIGQTIRIPKVSFEEWLDAHTTGGEQEEK